MKKKKELTHKDKLDFFLKGCKDAFFNTYYILATFFGGGVIAFLILNQNYSYSPIKSILFGIFVFALVFFIRLAYIFYIMFIHEVTEISELHPYGEAIKKLSYAFSIIHNLGRKEEPVFEDVIHSMEEFCTVIKQTFDDLTGCTHSVSVKIILKPKRGNKQRVITLCRDLFSKNNREPHPSRSEHFIEDNSCFQYFYINIGRGKGKYYLNNHLPKDTSYKNSSFNYYGEVPNTGGSSDEDRSKNWTLPYKSELVVPLAPLNSSDLTKELFGFICLDCDQVGAFLEKYDPYVLMGIADGMYNTMKKFTDKNILN